MCQRVHLTIERPLAYTSYALQGQTNAIGAGLSTNWRTVPGTISNKKPSLGSGQRQRASFSRWIAVICALNG